MWRKTSRLALLGPRGTKRYLEFGGSGVRRITFGCGRGMRSNWSRHSRRSTPNDICTADHNNCRWQESFLLHNFHARKAVLVSLLLVKALRLASARGLRVW